MLNKIPRQLAARYFLFPLEFSFLRVFLFFDRFRTREAREVFVVIFNVLQLLFCQIFKIEKEIVSLLLDTNKFIKFNLNRCCITILRILNQKNHQKGDNGCPCINDKLPGI